MALLDLGLGFNADTAPQPKHCSDGAQFSSGLGAAGSSRCILTASAFSSDLKVMFQKLHSNKDLQL